MNTMPTRTPGLRPLAILLVALSLSIGWGVRGNWGHEFGAMIPGALAAMAAVIVSGRPDWHHRIAYFGMFGALGWSFGGSISYMIVIGYTHNPAYFDTCLWGYAGLFLIGFCWGAIGAAGTALPAVASRTRLTEFFTPLLFVFGAWLLAHLLMMFGSESRQVLDVRFGPTLANLIKAFDYDAAIDWYDTDWLAALFALGAICLLALVRHTRRLDFFIIAYIAGGVVVGHVFVAALGLELPRPYAADSQQRHNWGALIGLFLALSTYFARRELLDRASLAIHYMAVGWFVGLLLLVELPIILLGNDGAVGIRLTPPRSDNWAGALGMTLALLVYLLRHRLTAVAWAGLLGGLIGGVGFSGAALIKLLAVTSGFQTNWHSVLEQTYGFINGIGIALVLGYLSTRVRPVSDNPPLRRWTEPVAVIFTLLVVTYLSIRKNLWAVWLQGPGGMTRTPVPEEMYGLSAVTWFHLAYAALALVVILPLVAMYRGRRIAAVPANWLGRGQILFLVLLWWIVIGNLSRYLPFNEQRLITEGVIHLNACLVTLLALLLPRVDVLAPQRPLPDFRVWLARTLSYGIVAIVLIVFAQATTTRAVWGTEHPGHAGVHVRFGPDNTNQPQ